MSFEFLTTVDVNIIVILHMTPLPA